MAEWKLFNGEPPESAEYLAGRPWMDLAHQPGFAERSAMVVCLIRFIHALHPVKSITDLGCGDGALLRLLPPAEATGWKTWGYDLGPADVAHGQARGQDLRLADITRDDLEYGELVVATEVAEHLENPHKWLASLPRRMLILSSPSAETDVWHNPIHSWAWDMAGYRDLAEGAGWRVAYHTDCDGGENTFNGVRGVQRFQALVAVR